MLNTNGVHLGRTSLIVNNGGSVELDAPASGPKDDGTILINSGDLSLRNPAFLGTQEHIGLSKNASVGLTPILGIGGPNPGGADLTLQWDQNFFHTKGMMDFTS